MAGFLEIPTIGEIWAGSSLEIPPVVPAGIAEGTEYIPFVLAGLIVAVLVFSRQIIYGVAGSAAILFTPANRSDLAEGLSFKKAANITTLFCIPAAALILVLTGISRQDLSTTAIAIGAYLLLQILACRFTDCFANPDSNDSGMVRGRSIFILFTVVSIPAAIISATGGKSFAYGYTVAVASIAAMLFAFSSFRTIFSSRFSYFFSFLYLCGIQFLPLAAAVKILLD